MPATKRARAAAQAESNLGYDPAYIASKYALSRWVRRESTRQEWAGSGILLNGVHPGMVKTPKTMSAFLTEEGRVLLKQLAPIAVADYCEPDVLAEAICFLATLEGSYLLGQMLFVDGGSDALIRPEIF